MSTYLRAASATASVIILAACAATTHEAKPNAGTSAAVADNHACLTQTGSRIATKGTDCSAPGRSYSSEDIDRTGATTADEALRLMDPSILIHH
jgi:hypothetical protein